LAKQGTIEALIDRIFNRLFVVSAISIQEFFVNETANLIRC